jgi:hypothetical protein
MWAESRRGYDWLSLPMVPAHWSISPRTEAEVLLNKQHEKATWRIQRNDFTQRVMASASKNSHLIALLCIYLISNIF